MSEQSRIIRKKPVMIQDISSSSPFPLTGLMRSDSISLKTMVVNSNRFIFLRYIILIFLNLNNI